MSLLKNVKLLKNKYKKMPSLSKASIKVITISNEMSSIYFSVTGSVKSIQIKYEGDIRDVRVGVKGIRFTHTPSKGIISINNYKAVRLDEKNIINYRGKIDQFRMVKVFGWGGGSILADKETPSYTKQNIQNNENIVGTSSEVLGRIYRRGLI